MGSLSEAEDGAKGHSRRLAAAVVVLVLLPYTTVGLPFRTALQVQAGGILAVLLVLGAASWLWRGGSAHGSGRERLPRLLVLGLALYAAAAAFGTVVGLARGNPLGFLAGQVLSMALLPLGALAGLGVAATARWRALRAALPLAVGAAACLHASHWGLAAWRGTPTQRFFLDNSVSVDGAALSALLMALAATGEALHRRSRWARFWPGAALGLIAVYLVGSGTRGLWATAPLAATLFFLAVGEAPWRGRRGLVVASVGALALVLAIGWLGAGFLAERPDWLAAAREAADPKSKLPGGGALLREHFHWRSNQGPRVIVGPLPAPEPGAYRLSAETRAAATGRGRLTVRCLDAGGKIVSQLTLATRGPAVWNERSVIGALPAGCFQADLEIGGLGEATGVWVVRRPRLERLGPEGAAGVLAQLAYWSERLRGLAAVRSPGEAALTDPSVRLRLAESRTLLGILSAETRTTQALGHGLGATFVLHRPLAGDGAEPRNYIHNFYVFLLFKLGWVGALAVLAALVLWTGQAWHACRRAPRGEARPQAEARPQDEARYFLAAAAAAWPAYAVLAVSSPEILNFRVAPLLGLLLAATAGATVESRSRGSSE